MWVININNDSETSLARNHTDGPGIFVIGPGSASRLLAVAFFHTEKLDRANDYLSQDHFAVHELGK